MNKSELIDSIREFNSTASVEFLVQFEEDDLKEYMDHLLEVHSVKLTAATPGIPFNWRAINQTVRSLRVKAYASIKTGYNNKQIPN